MIENTDIEELFVSKNYYGIYYLIKNQIII